MKRKYGLSDSYLTNTLIKIWISSAKFILNRFWLEVCSELGKYYTTDSLAFSSTYIYWLKTSWNFLPAVSSENKMNQTDHGSFCCDSLLGNNPENEPLILRRSQLKLLRHTSRGFPRLLDFILIRYVWIMFF